MLEKTKDWLFPGIIIMVILAGIMFVGYFSGNAIFTNKLVEQVEKESFGGRSSPIRDIIGTTGSPTATSSVPVQLNADNDLSAITTSTVRISLLGAADADGSIERDSITDSVLVIINQDEASTTNSLHWHIMGSNDLHCDTIATSTTDDNYDATEALTGDIRWYDLIAADVTASGMDNSGNIDISSTGDTADLNASSTSFLLTDVNWNCLKVEYAGASTTVLMQIKEKILTID
jgi:hypothetical protein